MPVNNTRRTTRSDLDPPTGFAMSGEGVPTLQADQLNVIAPHLHNINNKQDIWTDKEEWPVPIDSPESITEQIRISKLIRHKLQGTGEWDKFLKSEWKQLNRYNKVEMFGDPVKEEQEGMTMFFRSDITIYL